MSYSSFLLAQHQLKSVSKARIVIGGHLIFVEQSPCEKKWTLRTEVGKAVSADLRHSVSALGTLRYQERGAYLKLDPETEAVHLIQEISSSGKYAPFRYLMHDFAAVASEWRTIFSEN